MDSAAACEAAEGFMEERDVICATSEINYLSGGVLDGGEGAQMNQQEMGEERPAAVRTRGLPARELEFWRRGQRGRVMFLSHCRGRNDLTPGEQREGKGSQINVPIL